MRLIWLMLGVMAAGIGIVGIFLPLLPTTPFMILAAWAFARSSERLHARLLAHPVFGPMIRDWRDTRSISRRAKGAAIIAMAAAFAFSLFLGIAPWALAAQGVVLVCTGTWIATRPSSPRDAARAHMRKGVILR